MAEWTKYTDKTPIDFNNLVHKKKYFMTGPGVRTGEVTVLSIEPEYGINVKYNDDKQYVIYPDDKSTKLYDIIQGGRRTRRNRKSRKHRRKRSSRTGRRI